MKDYAVDKYIIIYLKAILLKEIRQFYPILILQLNWIGLQLLIT